MTIHAILQARMTSTRLPGKVLKEILGQPMLSRQIERLQKASMIDKIIIATSNEPSDDPIALLCQQLCIPCVRGSLHDVLGRYYLASQTYPSQHVVRITGDCPLIDPAIVDQVIQLHLEKLADYTSNCLHQSFPDGLDIEIFTQQALIQAYQFAKKPEEREHVTPYIYNHPDQFSQRELYYPHDLSFHRWTVDQPEDFTLVNKIYEQLYPENPNFALADILRLIEQQPSLSSINAKHPRNDSLLSPTTRQEVQS
ncbi:glycosyltransferase family protein [Thalassotalea sp. SU-HH00458]|uniref:glycosyltransferase family protein n=1 Tax=Thalassotalea sp. SU-HH00458 TaxID=3127657 RepID=UPI0031069BFD